MLSPGAWPRTFGECRSRRKASPLSTNRGNDMHEKSQHPFLEPTSRGVHQILAFARAQIPRVKSAAPTRRQVATATAIRAGWERKEAKPPQPRTASPRKARVPPTVTNAILGVTVMAASALLAL